MVKKLTALSLAMVMPVVLAACGSGSDSTNDSNGSASSGAKTESTDSAAAAAAGKITIKYWYAFGEKVEEAKLHMVKAFNESQDKIEVIAEHQGNYDDLHAKVQAAFAAGDAPAVTDLEIASTGVFARSGMLQELTT
ncbi:extracellular solute-binding protein [Paenibacillus solisilvae]|uniref:Extracellular solute-binding protein n=1 Tax=Paenibacillus solisilvae TaxID=2486751 RepID=A0ABW0VUJ4_9BACL